MRVLWRAIAYACAYHPWLVCLHVCLQLEHLEAIRVGKLVDICHGCEVFLLGAVSTVNRTVQVLYANRPFFFQSKELLADQDG